MKTILFSAAIIILALPSISRAIPSGYEVIKIADGYGAHSFQYYDWAALNENGEVCYKGASSSESAIIKGNGLERTLIASTTDASGLFEQFYSGICSINDSSDIAFDACTNCKTDGNKGTTETAVYRRSASGILSTIAQTGTQPGDFKSVALPTINNAGQVSFSGELQNGLKGIWIRHGADLLNPFNTDGPFSAFGGVFLNDAAQLTFGAQEDSSENYGGIYGSTGARIIGTFNGFSSVSLPMINNNGKTVALAISSDSSGGSGVYIDGVPFILNSTGGFSQVAIDYFQAVSMNDRGDVVFPAIRSNGKSVVFLAVQGGMLTLLEQGDLIPGYKSPVTFIMVGREAINDSRQVALVVALKDETELVVRFDPINVVFPDDSCPLDNAKYQPGTCGCGTADVDSNDDGILDCQVTSTVRQIALALKDRITKLKRVSSKMNKKNKARQRAFSSEAKKLSKQLYMLVKDSQAQVKLKSASKAILPLTSALRSQVLKTVKTNNRTFAADRKKALANVRKLLASLAES